MTDKRKDQSDLHLLAARQLELAADHNRRAAECYEQGEIDQARYHAFIAEGHYLDAGPLAERLSGLSTALLFMERPARSRVRRDEGSSH